MGRWTIAHRVRWFADEVRRKGLKGLWNGVHARVSPRRRAIQRRRIEDGVTFDAAHGYRTADVMAIDDLDIATDRTGSRHYVGAATYDIQLALATLDLPIEEATFIDLGCGMGRPMLMAADLPFKHIIGVEFARELVEIAAANIAQRARRHGADARIELVHGDASRPPTPSGPLAYFFYNPFGPPGLNRALELIHASWKQDPRPIRFIYVNIEYMGEMLAAGFVSRSVAPNYSFQIFEPQ